MGPRFFFEIMELDITIASDVVVASKIRFNLMAVETLL
jgi:hypothetical protein